MRKGLFREESRARPERRLYSKDMHRAKSSNSLKILDIHGHRRSICIRKLYFEPGRRLVVAAESRPK